MPCYECDDGSLHCGYGNPDNYGTFDSGGGSSGGGGDTGDGGNTGGDGVTPPWWMNLPERETEYNAAAGDSPQEEQDRYHRDLQSQLMFLEGNYNNNLPYQENFDIWLQGNKIYGPQTDQELRDAIQRDQENLKNAGYCHDLSQAGGNIANDPTCRGILLTQAMGQGHDSASAMLTSGAPMIAGSVLSGYNSIRRSLPISLPEDGLSSSEGPLNIGSGQTESNTSAAEGTVKTGGAYKDVPKNGGQNHHMPANSVSPYSRDEGPVINMSTEDHMQTASWGNSKSAQAYRAQQQELINSGDFLGAQRMDINDVQTKFGDKYNVSIQQMLDYTMWLLGGGK